MKSLNKYHEQRDALRAKLSSEFSKRGFTALTNDLKWLSLNGLRELEMLQGGNNNNTTYYYLTNYTDDELFNLLDELNEHYSVHFNQSIAAQIIEVEEEISRRDPGINPSPTPDPTPEVITS